MSGLFYHTMQDNLGNLLFGVTGTMRLAGTGTLATIYGNEALNVIIPNPMTNHPSFGSFKCYLAPGSYDFYMAKAGYTFETLTGLQADGTMALQNADAVGITGGSAEFDALGVGVAPAVGYAVNVAGLSYFDTAVGIGVLPSLSGPTLDVNGTAHFSVVGIAQGVDVLYALALTGNTYLGGFVGIGIAPTVHLDVNGSARVRGFLTVDNSVAFSAGMTATALATFNGGVKTPGLGLGGALATPHPLQILYDPATRYGILIQPSADSGPRIAIAFTKNDQSLVGSVSTTGVETFFNTTSDGRLKTAVQTLVGELALIRALRPVRFRWLADNSEGVGFLASEVQEHVQGVVTGEADAVNPDGTINPQQIDHSKLVPWLVGALQTLASQVETLTERVQVLEAGV